MESALALVHSRFSTNTFPSWDRAHPYRYIAHNGEINTLRGNINWMHAREALFESEAFGDDIQRSAHHQPQRQRLGDVRQHARAALLAGRSLPHAVMMMIPEPWSNHESMDDGARVLPVPLEPDGALGRPGLDRVHRRHQIGAVLDRNGLRPSRYYVTTRTSSIMASEAGVLDVPPEDVVRKGRLQPGRMFLVDTEQGRIVEDEEIKRTRRRPSGPTASGSTSTWSRRRPAAAAGTAAPDPDTLLQRRSPSATPSKTSAS
jgi:hypothetical protein